MFISVKQKKKEKERKKKKENKKCYIFRGDLFSRVRKKHKSKSNLWLKNMIPYILAL